MVIVKADLIIMDRTICSWILNQDSRDIFVYIEGVLIPNLYNQA